MEHVLDNGTLRVVVSDAGAELRSVRRDGAEWLWQGDPAFWSGRAPFTFPICGRLPGGRYRWRGASYSLGTHGFARLSAFVPVRQTETSVLLSLRADEATRAHYPFAFALEVAFSLSGDTLETAATVHNEGDVPLPFAFGGHPGFRVPLGGGPGSFGDWRLVFDAPCDPERILFSDACLRTGRLAPFPLRGGNEMPLSHDLFDDDAIFLSGATRGVSLRSSASRRFVRMAFPDFPYFGVWHTPRTEAPFVCLEPWAGLPSLDQPEEDFETKEDLLRLSPGASRTFRFSIAFGVDS